MSTRTKLHSVKAAPAALIPIVCGLVLAACAAEPPTPTPSPTAALAEHQLRVLEQVDQLIRDEYLYADFGGVDWAAEVALVRHRIEQSLSDEQFAQALSQLLAQLPAGTASYTSRAERIAAELESSAVYEGIGAFVAVRGDPDPRVLLLSVIQGSPAEQAGLQAHDAVYAVDGAPIAAEEGMEVINRVRGPAGTEVLLEVASPGEQPREVSVRRGQVTATDSLKGGLLTADVAYVLVPVTADMSVVESLAGLLINAEEDQPISGLVLDLRIASSGAQWPLAEMLTLFGAGDMGHFTSRQGDQPIEITGAEVANSQSVPLVILIGPDTSGSPEILAAALQARNRAVLVGLPTSGSILSFSRSTLSDGSQLMFAESAYITPAGQDLSRSGVLPDVRVEADWDQVEPGNDPVVTRALQLLSND